MSRYVLILLITSISLTSCSMYNENLTNPESNTTQFAHSTNIIYLHEQTTKYTSTQDAFNAITNKGNVIVDFYADWCGPCRSLGNTLEKIAGNYPAITILKVDVDQFSNIAAQFGVRSIPVLCFFKNGSKIQQTAGSKSAGDLNSLIKKIF